MATNTQLLYITAIHISNVYILEQPVAKVNSCCIISIQLSPILIKTDELVDCKKQRKYSILSKVQRPTSSSLCGAGVQKK
jgi:hypothetical protein